MSRTHQFSLLKAKDKSIQISPANIQLLRVLKKYTKVQLPENAKVATIDPVVNRINSVNKSVFII